MPQGNLFQQYSCGKRKMGHSEWFWTWKNWIHGLNIIISRSIPSTHVFNLWNYITTLASTDLNAYFSIPACHNYQKYLKFVWNNKQYQFTYLAQGLSSAPWLFTKVMKQVFAYLREKGHLCSGYHFLDWLLLRWMLVQYCRHPSA